MSNDKLTDPVQPEAAGEKENDWDAARKYAIKIGWQRSMEEQGAEWCMRDFIAGLRYERFSQSAPSAKEEGEDWDEAFTNVPVRVHPKTEEYFKSKYQLYKSTLNPSTP